LLLSLIMRPKFTELLDQIPPLHWIFYPAFDGKSLKVSVPVLPRPDGPLFVRGHQVLSSFVMPLREDHLVHVQGQQIFLRGPGRHIRYLEPSDIEKPRLAPTPNTNLGLLAIIEGQYAGTLVRRVHHHPISPHYRIFVAIIENAGSQNETVRLGPLLSVSPEHVVDVNETGAEKKRGNALLASLKVEVQKAKFSNFLYV
jgi:hypothetical protein